MASVPGILPLTIVRGLGFPGLILQCTDAAVSVAGTLSPNVVGVFQPSGTYNNYPLFILEGSPSTFIYVNVVAASFVIAQTLTDAALTNYWSPAVAIIGSDPSGSYLPHGTNTGTATVTDHPTNLTGLIVESHVRREPGQDILINLNPSITNALGGQITYPPIGRAESYYPFAGNFLYDCILKDAADDPGQIVVKGPFQITDNITRD